MPFDRVIRQGIRIGRRRERLDRRRHIRSAIRDGIAATLAMSLLAISPILCEAFAIWFIVTF